MKKKFLCGLLISSMILSLTACGGKGGKEAGGDAGTQAEQNGPNQNSSQEDAGRTGDEQGGSGQSHSTPNSTGEQEKKDIIKVTLFQNSSRMTDADNEMVHDAIMEYTGIDLELNYVSENAGQKYALLAAGGTLPDISVLTPDMYLEYAAQGAYYDITDLVGKYPNIMAYVPEDFWDRVSVDGRIYGIPTNNTEGKYNIHYRGDWLENLGLSVPATREEFTEVLRAFTQDDPDGNGKNDTYGYGNAEFRTFYAMFGIMPGYYHENNGKIRIDAISGEYKECLQYIHDLYQAGYIDPEIFTDTEDQFKQKVNQGKFGAFTAWWSAYGQFLRDYGFQEAQPGGTLITAVPPVDQAKGQGMPANDSMSGIICFSYQDGQIIEELLNYVDWIATDFGYRTCKYGIEGIHWSMKDGEVDYNAVMEPGKLRLDGKPLEGNDVETYSILQKMDIYPELLDETFTSAFVRAVENPLYRNSFVGLTSQDYTACNADLTKLCDEMRVKFILGDESFDRWDQYVMEYIGSGGLKVAESLLEEYNRIYHKSCMLESLE